MNDSIGFLNLHKHIIDPFKNNLGQKLESHHYYDISSEQDIITNENGLDVIAHQLELKFENNAPVYISWANIKNWHQYSLCISEVSFCNEVPTFVRQNDYWESVIGHTLKIFRVFGYKENEITTKEVRTGKTSTEIYEFEPHLLELEFSNGKTFGVANFYLENDFLPKLPFGDDIWIIFGVDYINKFIIQLNLEQLF